MRVLATCGMGPEYGIEVLRRVMLLSFISITCVVVIIPLGVVAHLQGNMWLGIADHAVAALIAANYVFVWRTRRHQIGSMVGLTIILVLYMFLLANGGVQNTANVWYFTFPLAASFLSGSRRGAIATVGLLFFALAFFALDLESEYVTRYSREFQIRFIPAFLVVFAFSYVFEASRESAVAKMAQKQEELERTVVELQEADAELRTAREDLERRVVERTVELSSTNAELVREIGVRERAEEERRALELQLARSHKMEAVGLLAGGVAHDLNNVLGAVVGFPELVLEELPEDSELHELVSMIKESGERSEGSSNRLPGPTSR